MNHPQALAKNDVAATAKLLVVLLAFAWGLNWIAAAVALREISPWSLRVAGSGIGATTLFAAAILTGHNLRVPRGEYVHVMVAGFFNVAAFQILSGFAQLSGATSRAIIITYSMPIWTTVLSRFVLGERLTAVRMVAFGLCVAGLGILLWPLFANGFPPFVFYSLGCALSWTIATVYIKWAKVTIEPLANAAWQLLFGLLFIAAGAFVFEDNPHFWPLRTGTVLAILFVGLFGVGLAHFLWWSIVGRLPTITASLGSLLVPVIGVSASAILLGERLTVPDIIGFMMIFAAAACVLLQPSVKHTEMPE
jgi:drug/metabolite transporter (DMT)-like permease